jgi:hypothetical protein
MGVLFERVVLIRDAQRNRNRSDSMGRSAGSERGVGGSDQLALRLGSVRVALRRAQDAIPRLTELDKTLGQRFDKRFNLLAGEVDGDAAPPRDATVAELVRKGEDLISETLAVLGGAAARHLDLDDGITSVALRWLDQLSDQADIRKVAAVVPAATEFIGVVTEVVRLKLPLDGSWGLPVAAHEYGHFVASVLSRTDDDGGVPDHTLLVEGLLHAGGADTDMPLIYWHGHELFADAIATALAGPAYPEYCLWYRFDPAQAQTVTPTHPSLARRMRVQLAVLRQLADADASGLIESDLDRISARWSDSVTAAGETAAVPIEELLEPLEGKLLEIVRDHPQLRPIRYCDHARARALAENDLDRLAAGTSVAQVLNAAWSARRAGPSGFQDQRTDQLSAKATALVKEVLDRA